MASTPAGNFTVLRSIANLMVVQKVAASGVAICFWDYIRIGAPTDCHHPRDRYALAVAVT
jgi:Na+/H+ antiporter NhaD/arsenite permease-like protein